MSEKMMPDTVFGTPPPGRSGDKPGCGELATKVETVGASEGAALSR